MLIYKICSEDAWSQAEQDGHYHGCRDDRADGFIHFSTATQLAGTAAKHFTGREDLVLVAVDELSLGEALKWESSRNGALFPHLYGTLDASGIEWVKPLPLDENGQHRFPGGI